MKFQDQLKKALRNVECLETFANILNDCFNEYVYEEVNYNDAIAVALVEVFQSYEHEKVYLLAISYANNHDKLCLSLKDRSQVEDIINEINDYE